MLFEPFSRRILFTASLAGLSRVGAGKSASPSIDRRRLVQRHNPILRQMDPLSPLSVGNGEFTFTADVTGLQSFPGEYSSGIPLCTQSHWGWHSFPVPAGMSVSDFRMTPMDTYGRMVGYPIKAEGQKEMYQWLRENPHRLNLARIGFVFRKADGSAAVVADLREMQQTLDLWTGVLVSRYRLGEEKVTVQTCAHPREDAIAVRVESSLIRRGNLEIMISFPYGSPGMDASDWAKPERHASTLVPLEARKIRIVRRLDEASYQVEVGWAVDGSFRQAAPHEYRLQPGKGLSGFEFVARFSPKSKPFAPLSAPRTFEESEEHWRRFWASGAAVDLEGSSDARAGELERRIVLSQYLTAIQCAGSVPPQETGLTCNSWNGKFHLEMHWWHAAHFALWNRLALLEKSLDWYRAILPEARKTAERQGYAGARWPKMVGPDGRESPSPIGPLLVWQQPHPIYYAELCHRTRPGAESLQRFQDVVFQTADFMASFAYYQKEKDRFVLGPPLIPAQENHAPAGTWNACYELAYWRWGLETACQWRQRLGQKPDPSWLRVLSKLSSLPVREGVYLAHENCPETFQQKNLDHPSMLAALGVLPGKGVDRETMRRTLQAVLRDWRWESTWGWDYPMIAMTAARLGEPEKAVDALLLETPKNRYLPNGHNWQRANLPLYLPGNGGLLAAIAVMTAGWEGSSKAESHPGWPRDGRWQVRSEGFLPIL